MIINLGKTNSIFNQYMYEIRDAVIQSDRMRFRTNLCRIGEIFAYEISKKLKYIEKEVVTPLGSININILEEHPVLATILRAGLPLHQGLLNFYDKSECAFISAYRKHGKGGSFKIAIEYVSAPEIENRILILSDPMLATGASMALAIEELNQIGKPKHIHIVSLVACSEGIDYLKRKINLKNVTLWVGAIDEELTALAYIVPGFGDAGDLSFGPKQ